MDKRDFQNIPAFKIHRLAWGLTRIAGKAIQDEMGMTFPHFMIMAVVNFKPECTQKSIAQKRHLTEAAISRQIEHMVDKGLITRQENSKNRREHILALTESGKEQLGRAFGIVKAKMEEKFAILNREEGRQLEQALDKLLKVVYTE
jgi:DNA-binding MarR family transcriptional regulator